jgi:hypothetical protein
MKMIALNRFTYCGKNLSCGDEFDAHSTKDARVLEAIKRAKPIPADPVPARPAPVVRKPVEVQKVIVAEAPAPAPTPEPDRNIGLLDMLEVPAADAETPKADPADAKPAAEDKPKRTYTRRDMVAEGGASGK